MRVRIYGRTVQITEERKQFFVMATQMNVTDLKTENNDTPDFEKRLPDAEFEVMLAIWNAVPPVNTAYLMEAVGKGRSWKAPTLISFLVRLEDRGYITSFKKGKAQRQTGSGFQKIQEEKALRIAQCRKTGCKYC